MRHRTFLLCLAVLCFLFFLLGNAGLAITDPVESNYALTAKEMVASGDWLSPQIYGIYWYDKPIFIYWMLCLSYSAFGFTDFAARLPGAFFSAVSVLLAAWYMLRRTQRLLAAALLAAMTTTSLEVWAIGHSVITDQMLFFFTSATMFFTYIGLTEKKPAYIRGAYVMAALAVLTKGPVGIVLPGIFFLIFIAIRRNTTYAKRLFPLGGILLFFAICLPWYGMMYARHGMDFINGFLGFNNVVRATISEHPEMNVWYYYLLLVPVSLLPWTGPCLYALWKRRRFSDEYVYMTLWALGTIIFYSLMATKYPTYSYVANMPLLYLGALYLHALGQKTSRRLWFLVTGPALFFWLLLFSAGIGIKPADFTLHSLTELLIFIPIAAAILLLAQWKRAFPAIPVIITTGTALIYLILMYQVLIPFYAYRSATALLPAASSFHGQLYFFEEYHTSFVYYTGLPAIYTAPSNYDDNVRLNRDEIWSKKHLFPTEEADVLIDRLRRHEPVWLIVPDSKYKHFMQSEFHDLTRPVGAYGEYHVFTSL
ncbi:ArnT family glycosyltransferase [Megasphaera cerevisiae]|uniref:ArnT family glycosyltransferase n=1 Tax=Megasphaera cerevisiae TaxID=39029 RepID=UPI00094349E2|nr:glycosyltransferase family 39 protein [Megasphaera cerevisiae]OKY54591.1 dolichyl-phosphate-mannose--protein mannosyltransferase [Megasphaera cerevisiae]